MSTLDLCKIMQPIQGHTCCSEYRCYPVNSCKVLVSVEISFKGCRVQYKGSSLHRSTSLLYTIWLPFCVLEREQRTNVGHTLCLMGSRSHVVIGPCIVADQAASVIACTLTSTTTNESDLKSGADNCCAQFIFWIGYDSRSRLKTCLILSYLAMCCTDTTQLSVIDCSKCWPQRENRIVP